MYQRIKNFAYHLPKSIFFSLRYGFPSRHLTLIGVTGTDGKTTTCTLLHHILTQTGHKTGLITTITSPGLHSTSPEPAELQKYFHQLVKDGYTHVVCEVTSHALDQFRYWGCQFAVSAITNVSQEHLDYHKNINNYIASKSKLFLQSNFAVLNRDDQSYPYISKIIKCPSSGYSIKNSSDYRAKNIRLTFKSLSFNVNKLKITTNSIYDYQVYNILATLAITDCLKIDSKVLQKTVKDYPFTKGRREEVKNNYKFTTIIDFAHTPNGLKQTLTSLKKITKGKLIVIFGATGGRDKQKRPIMGQVVTQLADITIITADDTRSEKIEDINKQIISGITEKDSVYYDIPNRQDAFNLAIKLAKPFDTVIACGKGHETTILHGTTEYPWSEEEAFKTAFRLRKEK